MPQTSSTSAGCHCLQPPSTIQAAPIFSVHEGTIQHLTAKMAAAKGRHLQLHFTSGGDVMATSIIELNEANAAVQLAGAIGPVPFDFDLSAELDPANKQIAVTLTMRQPLSYTHRWTFSLHPAPSAAAAEISGPADALAASGATLVRSEALGGSPIWCILKCGGVEVLLVLLECLPQLATSKTAFLACLAQNGGPAAAKIAACIASCTGNASGS